MRNLTFLLLIAGILSGCGAAEGLKRDYLKAEDYAKYTWRDSFDSINRNHLKSEKYSRYSWNDSWQSLKKNHLMAYEYDGNTWRKSWQAIKKEYFNSEAYDINSWIDSFGAMKKKVFNVDLFDDISWRNSWIAIRDDYLEIPDYSAKYRGREDVLLKAKSKLLKSSYKEDYQIESAAIDYGLGQPETHKYYFIHFTPRIDREKVSETTYLVVMSRYQGQIVYADMFGHPKGDPYYMYQNVLRKIGR